MDNCQLQRKFKSFMSIIHFRDLLVKYQQTNRKSTYFLISRLRKFDLERKNDELLVSSSSHQLNQLMPIQTFNKILIKKSRLFNVDKPKSLRPKSQKWIPTLKRHQLFGTLNSETLFKMASVHQVFFANQLKSHM